MKKFGIIFFSFFVVFIAILLGIYVFSDKDNKNNNGEIIGEKLSEEIYDECTEEGELILESKESNIIETNTKEEKITPNCVITLKRYYKGCKHITNEYLNVPQELVNKTEEDLQKKYKDWIIKKFSSTEIELYREFEGKCGEHFVLRENNGKIVINKISEDDKEIIFEETDISVDYLSEEDKEAIKEGIKVFGNENLNQVIEDFE